MELLSRHESRKQFHWKLIKFSIQWVLKNVGLTNAWKEWHDFRMLKFVHIDCLVDLCQSYCHGRLHNLNMKIEMLEGQRWKYIILNFSPQIAPRQIVTYTEQFLAETSELGYVTAKRNDCKVLSLLARALWAIQGDDQERLHTYPSRVRHGLHHRRCRVPIASRIIFLK